MKTKKALKAIFISKTLHNRFQFSKESLNGHFLGLERLDWELRKTDLLELFNFDKLINTVYRIPGLDMLQLSLRQLAMAVL